MKKLVLLVSLTGLFSGTAHAQNFDRTRLDKYFEVLEANDKFMGSVALSRNGEIIYTRQSGFSDVENQVKPDADTKYRIGSISKTFTAVLVFKAIEEGKLKLSDKLSQYYPEVPNAAEITIGNLLNHRSGIHNFTSDASYKGWETKKTSEKELIGIIVKGGSDFKPDSKGDYSNSNYVLLSLILQKVYKESFDNLLNEKIVKPLELKNTRYGKPASISDNETFSYSPAAGSWVKHTETDMSIPLGAGALVSTPSDLTVFADALFNGRLLAASSLDQMKTIKDNYGMGLFRFPFNSKTGYGHTGGIDNFTSVYCHFEADNVSVAITSNGNSFDNNTIGIALLSAVYDQPYELPSFETIVLTSEELNAYPGVYSSKDLPLKITVTTKENILVAQATGQPALELTATGRHTFSFEPARIVMEFNPSEKTFILKQNGGKYVFTKE